MCGIAGLVTPDASRAGSRIQAALDLLIHRGPDGQGFHFGDRIALGMRRLAVIDVEGGDQPIYNEDRTVVVVCNGEIYDHVERLAELRARGHRFQSRSDVNVIPHSYEELGRDAFTRCRGMFAAAVWDSNRRRLVLARDCVGKKPLYYSVSGDGLAFASEIPALLAMLTQTPGISRDALALYLQLGFVPHPWTIYDGIHALPPGSTLTFEPGGEPHVASYWRPSEPSRFSGTRREAIEEIDRRLREAVTLRLRSDVPLGLFLSGGIDSGLVAAYAAGAGAKNLKCFVVAVDDPTMNEAPAARLVAERLGLPIEAIPLRYEPRDAVERIPALYGQPFGDSSAIPSYYLARWASRHRKVVLNGDGGDEVFAGYRRYWLGRAAQWLLPSRGLPRRLLRWPGRRLAGLASRRSGLGFGARILRGLAADDASRYLIWTVDLLGDDELRRCFPDLAKNRQPLLQLQAVRGERIACNTLRDFQAADYRLILADDLLTKMDIATMAHGLEARSPFLDIPLAEFSWSLPERWLMTSRQTKPLLRALAERYLPKAIETAPKRGFEVPMRRWIRHELREPIHDLLLASDSRLMALGAPRALKSLIAGTDRFSGNHPQLVWCLLVLEVFLRSRLPAFDAAMF